MRVGGFEALRLSGLRRHWTILACEKPENHKVWARDLSLSIRLPLHHVFPASTGNTHAIP